jgi:tRNA G18 (ribose-2'-O)-methylase SpoU
MECAVILIDLKYSENLSFVLRACANLEASRLYWTGTRVLDLPKHPRPKRGRGRSQAEAHFDDFGEVRGERQRDPLALIDKLRAEGYTAIAVELKANSTSLERFKHPEKAVYVFGPEDGSLSEEIVKRCAQTVMLPTKGCAKISHAVFGTLLHRRLQSLAHGRLRVAG